MLGWKQKVAELEQALQFERDLVAAVRRIRDRQLKRIAELQRENDRLLNEVRKAAKARWA